MNPIEVIFSGLAYSFSLESLKMCLIFCSHLLENQLRNIITLSHLISSHLILSYLDSFHSIPSNQIPCNSIPTHPSPSHLNSSHLNSSHLISTHSIPAHLIPYNSIPSHSSHSIHLIHSIPSHPIPSHLIPSKLISSYLISTHSIHSNQTQFYPISAYSISIPSHQSLSCVYTLPYLTTLFDTSWDLRDLVRAPRQPVDFCRPGSGKILEIINYIWQD